MRRMVALSGPTPCAQHLEAVHAESTCVTRLKAEEPVNAQILIATKSTWHLPEGPVGIRRA